MKILLPLDGSHLSEAALDAVERLCAQEPGSAVEVLRVVDPMAAMGAIHLLVEQDRAAEYVSRQTERLVQHGITATSYVDVGPPARQIVQRVGAGGFNLICIATHGRSGLARAALGSVSDQVIRESSVPVVVVPPRLSQRRDPPWPGNQAEPADLICLFARRDTLSLEAAAVLVGRGREAVPAVIAALTDSDAAIRQYALRVLAGIGDPGSLSSILQRLDDEVFEVRWEAGEAVEAFGEAGVRALLSLLTQKPVDARLASHAVYVLDRAPMYLHEAVKPVLEALRSDDPPLGAPLAAEAALRRLKAGSS